MAKQTKPRREKNRVKLCQMQDNIFLKIQQCI